MCGICGLWNLNGEPVDPALLVRMRDSLAHRGPDGAGCVLIDTRGALQPRLLTEPMLLASSPPGLGRGSDLGLGHRRLAIIDLTTGDQPQCNQDGSVWVVYN